MKKASLGFLLFFAITAVGINNSSYAVTNETSENSTNAEKLKEIDNTIDFEVNSASVSGEMIEYNLPYPGILPDHILYPLKKLRDNLLNFLIKDPLKRIEFNLLMADKRYAMGSYLADKEKFDLAVQIMEEAEKYYFQLISDIENAKAQNRNVSIEQYKKVASSGKKHQEVLQYVRSKDLENNDERYGDLTKTQEENLQKFSNIREE